MKIYLDLCDFSIWDNHIAIDITDETIDWYDQNDIEIEMDDTLENLDLIKKLIYKTPLVVIIYHEEDPDLSFSLCLDVLDLRFTQWHIYIIIKK